MKSYNRTLITESEKERILSLHMSNGYKTNNPLLLEKVQWRQNNTAPYKFLDHGENIRSLQKALGFPTNLQTGNFYVKTEAAVKNKMKELNLGEYSRDNGITQDTLDKIISSPTAQLSTTQLQQLQTQSAAGGTTTQGGAADPAQAKSSDAKIITSMMKVKMGDVYPSGIAFRLSYDGSATNGVLSKMFKLTINIIDTSNNTTYKVNKDIEFNSSNYYNDYYVLPTELTPEIANFSDGTTYKITVQFEDAGTVETTFKINSDQGSTTTQDTSYKIDLNTYPGWTVQQETRSKDAKTIGSVDARDYDYIATNGGMTYAVSVSNGQVEAFSSNGKENGSVNKTTDIQAAKNNVGLGTASTEKKSETPAGNVAVNQELP